jgi:hypothetical protein
MVCVRYDGRVNLRLTRRTARSEIGNLDRKKDECAHLPRARGYRRSPT